METVKHKKVPEGLQMISFYVKSLFSKVPLEIDKTMSIILRRINTKHELKHR